MKLADIYPTREEDINRVNEFESINDEQQALVVERAKLENQQSFKAMAESELEDAEKSELYKKVFEISSRVQERGGMVLVVGGFVRDLVMKSLGQDLSPKDVDIEVYGLEMSELKEVLSEFGNINEVGEQFGVLKLGDLDIAIPRSDSKKGAGHKGFEVKGDSKMQIREACKRRDLTINALALNPLTGEVIDAVGGLDDLINKKIRAVDPETFKDDPLRVLRVMQFAGRFGFSLDDETKEICKELVRNGSLKELSIERFEEEWKKLLLKSERPSVGLEVARDIELISYYPELQALIDCPQEHDWHPEGDVWTHTLMVLDEASKISRRENLDAKKSLVLLLSALCHDMGKPATTEVKEIKGVERITAYSHEEAGLEPARSFLQSIHISNEVIDEVLPLVVSHLFPTTYNDKITDAAVRRLAKKLAPASMKSLVLLGEADVHGRGYWDDQPNAIPEAKKWDNYPSGSLLLSHVDRLPDISTTSPKTVKYMTGKHLIQLGLNPKMGKKFGEILSELEKAQEENRITGPEDLRLAKLFVFLNGVESKEVATETLLTGDAMTKEEMMAEVKDRIVEIGTHDMGTIVMTLLLKGEKLPPILERNKTAILTAHKHGPAWFKHFEKEFYETSWKSFYGQFEVDVDEQKRLSELDFEEQLTKGIDLIIEPQDASREKYQQSFDIQVEKKSGKIAYYVTDQYPFETGMMQGFEVMVQFDPDKKRLCVSVMNEDKDKVREIDEKIRVALPEFRNARKVGYLFATNSDGEDSVFTAEDGIRVYNELIKILN